MSLRKISRKEELIGILVDLYRKQESDIICPAIWNQENKPQKLILNISYLSLVEQRGVYEFIKSLYDKEKENQERDIEAKIRARESELKKLI